MEDKIILKNELYNLLIENDLNPFLLFDSNGKIKDLNKEAEFLFNFTNSKNLFELAMQYAPISFGVRKEFVSLSYGKSNYYAVLIAYENEDELALKLYKSVPYKREARIINSNMKKTNIYSLIELSKNTIFNNKNTIFNETYDTSLPEFKINVNYFLLTINKCFNIFTNENEVFLKVFIKIGEYEIINGIKYKILCIEFKKISQKLFVPNTLINKYTKHNINIFDNPNSIRLELTMYD